MHSSTLNCSVRATPPEEAEDVPQRVTPTCAVPVPPVPSQLLRCGDFPACSCTWEDLASDAARMKFTAYWACWADWPQMINSPSSSLEPKAQALSNAQGGHILAVASCRDQVLHCGTAAPGWSTVANLPLKATFRRSMTEARWAKTMRPRRECPTLPCSTWAPCGNTTDGCFVVVCCSEPCSAFKEALSDGFLLAALPPHASTVTPPCPLAVLGFLRLSRLAVWSLSRRPLCVCVCVLSGRCMRAAACREA